MHFNDSYTNVSNLGGTLCSLRRGGIGSLRRVQIQTRYFLQSRTRQRPGPSRLPQVTVASVHFVSSFLVCTCGHASRWGLSCHHGISGAGLPLFNLFKKTIHNSFCAPIEREHELFLNSSHFDILLYLNGFVIWHCVLCILILFCFFLFLVPYFRGGCYSSALFLLLFFFSASGLWSCVWLSNSNKNHRVGTFQFLWMERSDSVNERSPFWAVVRAGHVLAPPPSRGPFNRCYCYYVTCSNTLFFFFSFVVVFFFFFFSLQGILVLMCKVINWYFMPITHLVCSPHWWRAICWKISSQNWLKE